LVIALFAAIIGGIEISSRFNAVTAGEDPLLKEISRLKEPK